MEIFGCSGSAYWCTWLKDVRYVLSFILKHDVQNEKEVDFTLLFYDICNQAMQTECLVLGIMRIFVVK